MKSQKYLKHLCVVIPCFNEEKTIKQVIEQVPHRIIGIGKISVVVIDDGSTDRSAILAKKAGAIVFSHSENKGLGITFKDCIAEALMCGADVIVNIDADLQFNPKDIPNVVKPVANGFADMATATRFGNGFSKNVPLIKRLGNHCFTWLVGILAGQRFSDTQCGFRAYSREAAMHLNLFGKFTYTQEVFLDLVNKGMRIVEVPVKVTYYKDRKAKISKSLTKYAMQSAVIILTTFRDIRPLVFFGLPGLGVFLIGFILGGWSLVYWLVLHHTTPVRMYLFTGIFLITFGFLMIMLALIADMFKHIRMTQEEMLYKVKKDIYDQKRG